jgi:hypothetical protein
MPFAGYTQKIVKGIVVDSTTLTPLANVHIQLKHKTIGTITDANGNFSITVSVYDTVIFSLIGYKIIERVFDKNETDILIRLIEESKVLNTVTVEDQSIKIEGLDPPAEDKFEKFQNTTYNPRPGEVATFGPGIRIGIGGAKDRKQKAKLQEVKEENEKAKAYIQVVSSPEVKEKLMKKYNLTEEEYYKLLEKFNEKYRGYMYNIDSKNLTDMIFNFFERSVTSQDN